MVESPQPPPVAEVWPIVNREDWLSLDFTRAKAYVCAIFAELAYWHIPAFELAGHDRVKVVPSDAYQELARRLVADDALVRLLRRADLAPVIIPQRYAIVVVVRTRHVIFVAIRGTAELYDWLINLNVRKIDLALNGGGRFHEGFYRAIEECFDPLLDELRRDDPQVPVYVTGHSLGGAMAALLHATWIACRKCGTHSHGSPTHSAYTYGMPRYADDEGVHHCRCPYHIIKSKDIVPRVPPMWLGYANSLLEYDVSGTRIQRATKGEAAPFFKWTWCLATTVAVTQHFIEGYRRDLVVP